MNLRGHKVMWYVSWVAVALIVALIAGGTYVYARFYQDMDKHRERIEAGSHVAETDCGVIEYGDEGNGVPVLVIHGSGGGYDQGLAIGRGLGEAFRIIAPSRFGYLNTPYPSDASVTAQTDSYVCLLDYLGIDRIPVIAVSAGGTSGLQLAQRYPERVESLIMVSAVSNVRPVREANESVQGALLTDFVYWAAVSTRPDFVLEFFGLSRAAQSHLTEEELDRAEEILDMMNPLEMRKAGLAHDSTESNLFDGAVFALDEIVTPTLVIHAKDDTFIPPVHGEYTAEHIPGARLVMLDEGGHFVMARQDVITAIQDFINVSHSASEDV